MSEISGMWAVRRERLSACSDPRLSLGLRCAEAAQKGCGSGDYGAEQRERRGERSPRGRPGWAWAIEAAVAAAIARDGRPLSQSGF